MQENFGTWLLALGKVGFTELRIHGTLSFLFSYGVPPRDPTDLNQSLAVDSLFLF